MNIAELIDSEINEVLLTLQFLNTTVLYSRAAVA